jgi:hypothetical protein
MESGWREARKVLDAVASGERQALASSDEAALDLFAGLYGDHIQAEEGLAYPAAAQLLDEAALAAMGREMMRRRGAA